MLTLALNILRDSQAINKTKSYTLVDSSYLTAVFFLLYKEVAGNSGLSIQQYVSGSMLFRPASWSGLERAVFAEGI